MKRYKILTVIICVLILAILTSVIGLFIQSKVGSDMRSWDGNGISFLNQSGLDPLLPDYYSLTFDDCNKCGYKVNNFGTYFTTSEEGCTELGCWFPNNDMPEDVKERIAQNDSWLQLHSEIQYVDLPAAVNTCVNGYKNRTYVDYAQKHLGLSDVEITSDEKLREAIRSGIHKCEILYKQLYVDAGFNDKKIRVLMNYLSSRQLPADGYSTLIDNEEVVVSTILNDLFSYIDSEHNITGGNNITGVITADIINDFKANYEQRLQEGMLE